VYDKPFNFIEFCLYDDGISIPESLRNYNDRFKSLEDCYLINKALNGQSTKGNTERGYGMNTSANIIVDGLRGEMFVASKKGAIYMNHGHVKHYRLPSEIKGTLIGLRVPRKEVVINLYNFLEKKWVIKPSKEEPLCVNPK